MATTFPLFHVSRAPTSTKSRAQLSQFPSKSPLSERPLSPNPSKTANSVPKATIAKLGQVTDSLILAQLEMSAQLDRPSLLNANQASIVKVLDKERNRK